MGAKPILCYNRIHAIIKMTDAINDVIIMRLQCMY